jgi:hypothetical protein
MTARERIQGLIDDPTTSYRLRDYLARALDADPVDVAADPVDVANELAAAYNLALVWAHETLEPQQNPALDSYSRR